MTMSKFVIEKQDDGRFRVIWGELVIEGFETEAGAGQWVTSMFRAAGEQHQINELKRQAAGAVVLGEKTTKTTQ